MSKCGGYCMGWWLFRQVFFKKYLGNMLVRALEESGLCTGKKTLSVLAACQPHIQKGVLNT